jgi:hypothetical protein
MERRVMYDRRDIDRTELMLIRAGHYLWLDAKRRANVLTVDERGAITASLETIWEAKRVYRVYLAEKRKIEGAAYFAKFRGKSGSERNRPGQDVLF